MTKKEELELEDFLKKVSTPPDIETHTRKANLFMCNDVIFSRDIHVLDVLTQHKDDIKEEDWNKWKNDVFKIINNPRISPLVGIRETEFGLELFTYNNSVNVVKTFIHSKANSFILQNVAIEIRDKYLSSDSIIAQGATEGHTSYVYNSKGNLLSKTGFIDGRLSWSEYYDDCQYLVKEVFVSQEGEIQSRAYYYQEDIYHNPIERLVINEVPIELYRYEIEYY